MRLILLIIFILLNITVFTQIPEQSVQSFTIRESFGVSHPDQILDFDLKSKIDADNSYLLGENGIETPYQLIEDGKKLALRTDLPANSVKTWTLYTGRAPKLINGGVLINETTNAYDITNGLTGVRIPKAVDISNGKSIPSPIQGIRLHDGTWTALNSKLSVDIPGGLQARMTVKFLEKGALKTIIQIRYDFEATGDKSTIQPENKFSVTTIDIQSGQPSVIMEEESNIARSYNLEMYDAIHPTIARYRGHHSDSKAAGYEPDGQVYRAWHMRPSLDAQVDLTFSEPRSYGKIARWDPWITNSGWYWQMFDDKAWPETNFIGAFAGKASRQIGAAVSGVEGYTAPAGMSDIVTIADAKGVIHSVYTGNGGLWLVSIDNSLKPGKPVKIADGLINPDVSLLADDSLCVVAYNPQLKQFVEIVGKNGGLFTNRPLSFVAKDGVTVGDPYAYLAVRGDTQFLFFYGEGVGKREGMLFSRKIGEKDFIFQTAIAGLGYYRQICRPSFSTLPDGRVILLTDVGGYVNRFEIKPATLTFSSGDRLGLLNTGTAIDPITGGFIISNGGENGNLRDYPATGDSKATNISLGIDHYGQGANRRTLVTAPDGTAVLLFGGNSDNAYTQSTYRRSVGTWTAWSAVSNLGLACTRVHYDKNSGQFIFIGRKNGKFTVYTCKTTDTVPVFLFNLPETEARRAGLNVAIGLRSPDARVFKHVRYQWGLFVGRTGYNLKPATDIQPIAKQMNLHSGINLNKIQHYTLDFPDPPQGYGAMYMPKAATNSLITKLRADKSGVHGGGFHSWLYNVEPMGRDLIDLWADTSGKQAAKLTGEIAGSARSLLDMFVNGDGIYSMPTHYWHGGLEMSRKLVWLDQLMGSDQTTPEEKTRLKATTVLFGSILYDNDFVPLDNCDGINLGTPNMPVQQQNYRQMYALMLANHPMMKDRVRGVSGAANSMLNSTVNEFGAHMGSLHYVGAANGPLLATYQQLQMAGVEDAFANNDRLAKFAEFYMQALTPVEVRFGKNRKMAAIGDGGTEGTEEYGMMGTGFAKSKPELSQRLMGAWRENGKIHTGFHGSTLLKINDDLPGITPNLGDAKFPGYYSVLRSGWGTPDENAIWCVNGNFYIDHCHNDLGELVMYLLGAPLSIDWGPIYSPRVSGGVMHSTVIQESEFGQSWDKDITNLDNGVGFSGHYGNYGVGEATSLNSYQDGKRMVSTIRSGLRNGGKPEDITTWIRTVSLVTVNPKLPVVLIRDTFNGKDAKVPKIWSMNLMADGDVETPVGKQTPPLRTFPYADKVSDPATQMPSAGSVISLVPGINRFGFNGQKWKGHQSEGIDWDLYVVNTESQQAQIGNWANLSSPSSNEFQSSQGRKYEERQHILRLKGTGDFTTVIVPWNKGAKPNDVNITRDGEIIIVKIAENTIRFKADGTWEKK